MPARARAPVPPPPTAATARTAARARVGSRCRKRTARPRAARSPNRPTDGGPSAGAKLKVALADDLLVDQVDQKRAPLADHPVEGLQVPHVEGPADVPAL